MLASPALALQLAAPNAVGTMVGFGISYAVASVAFGGGRAKGAAPSARETLGGMARENVPRVRTLSVALAAVAALVISGAGANMVMPTFAQQAVYSVWFAMMALVDELHDTMPTLSPGRSDPPGPLLAGEPALHLAHVFRVPREHELARQLDVLARVGLGERRGSGRSAVLEAARLAPEPDGRGEAA